MAWPDFKIRVSEYVRDLDLFHGRHCTLDSLATALGLHVKPAMCVVQQMDNHS